MYREMLSPENKKKMRDKRIKDKEEMTSDYQFGYFVGENIYYNILPTISIDSIHTRHLIKVSYREKKEFERLEKLWSDKYDLGKDEAKEEWEEVMKFRRKMENKYLPPILDCTYWLMNIRDMKEFKKGLISSLWNCDICHYKLEEDEIEIFDDKDLYFTTIRLKLGD